MLLHLYRVILEMNGHEVLGEAFNGHECIESIKHRKLDPDFILLDHRMPIKNGLDTMKELLKIKPDLKIIFLSADVAIKETAYSEGAVGFIEKPFDLSTFFKSIEKLSCNLDDH